MAPTTAAQITAALTAAGAPLSLPALADELDLATNPVRMALRRLTLAGTVVRIDTEGDLTRWAMPAAEVAEAEEAEEAEVPAHALRWEENRRELAEVRATEAAAAEAPAAPALADACHCGADEVGHVHPRQITAAPKARKGKGAAVATSGRRAEAWAKATEALRAAGAAGMAVPEVWEVLQAQGMSHQAAYTLVNEHKGELVVVAEARAVRERRVALAAK